MSSYEENMPLNRTFRLGRFIWTLFVTWYFINFSRNFFNSLTPDMSKIPALFFLFLVLWLAIEYYFGSPFLQSGIVSPPSLARIIFAIFFYGNLVYCIADYSYYHWSQLTLPFINIIGIIIFSIGILLRYYTLYELLRLNPHKFPKSGIFNACRHPRYVATALQTISIPLFFSSYLGFLFSVFIGLPIIYFEIKDEERNFAKRFSEEFTQYKMHVPMILPKLSRISIVDQQVKQKNKSRKQK